MKRFPLPAAMLALALPTAGAGESINLNSSDFVARVTETLRDPVVRGGFGDAAFDGDVGADPTPEPVRAGEVDVYFGARPKAGKVAMDVGYGPVFEAGGSDVLALPVGQPVGQRGRVGALVRFDTAGTSAKSEARAMVTVARGYRAGGSTGGRIETGAPAVGVDVGLSRLLADLCSIDPRYRDVLKDARRVDLPLQAKF